VVTRRRTSPICVEMEVCEVRWNNGKHFHLDTELPLIRTLLKCNKLIYTSLNNVFLVNQPALEW